MCGIAGILEGSRGTRPRRSLLEEMIHTLEHRGPDGFGYFDDGPVGLAHARLSIIDLATGQQPMSDAAGGIWVVFNGEIFDYLELRARLEQLGHRFATQSDTETIIHAYAEYGTSFVEHLNGQFAIALWDKRRERLILARDRLGIRPLYYTSDGDRFVFASEVKALRPALSRALRLAPQGLAQVFTLWGCVDPHTTFEGISSLPPGHLLVLENGQSRLTQYWRWQPATATTRYRGNFASAVSELRELLVDAVRLQLRADVPVGAYLSGGLDSSALAALVLQVGSAQLHTFSVEFDDTEFDESVHQQQMARHLGTAHSGVRCSRADIGRLFPKLIQHCETPVLRTAPVPMMMLSELVRRSGYKVVLTGEGADEVFAGYDLFKEAKIRRFWARAPQSQWRPALLGRLYPWLKNSPVASGSQARSFYGQNLLDVNDGSFAHEPRWTTSARLLRLVTPALRAEIGETPGSAVLATSRPADMHDWEGLARDQYTEVRTLLSGYLLSSQGDRVAMANSVEGRVPFLDHRVVEFANSLPARYKLKGLQEKAILKAAVADLLPESITRRVKQPYRAPDSASFFADGQPLDYVAHHLSAGRLREAGYFDPAAAALLVEKCRAGKALGFADNMAFVGMLSTMLLHEAFVN